MVTFISRSAVTDLSVSAVGQQIDWRVIQTVESHSQSQLSPC